MQNKLYHKKTHKIPIRLFKSCWKRLMKKEESVRKKSLELGRNVNWKQKNNSYVIQILKNK